MILCIIRRGPASNLSCPCLSQGRLQRRQRCVIYPCHIVTPRVNHSNPSSANAQVSFLLASAARPETIATRFATVRLIQTTLQGFVYELWMMTYQAKSISDQLHKVRQIYETQETKNKVVDGAISFPEERQSLRSGITVEFRYVLFSSGSFLAADVSPVFVRSEMSPSVTPPRMILRSVMYHSRSRRASFVSVKSTRLLWLSANSELTGYCWDQRLREEHHTQAASSIV